MKVAVLRIGHRVFRDQRMTTHCALVARAFGADEIIVSGEADNKLVESVRKVALAWGGDFKVREERNWKNLVRNWDGLVIHLTMYGMPFDKKMPQIKKSAKSKNVLLVVGAEKVPRELYDASDYNISITSQPHSEVAALAIFLHELLKGKDMRKKFKNARIKLIPQQKGKKIIKV
ncbi:MAG: tRNA (cytidine(56)-2'-O)-methyltransferase [Candidatus Aenigmatarchaeota archaeon]